MTLVLFGIVKQANLLLQKTLLGTVKQANVNLAVAENTFGDCKTS
jgi:hypothetical protein